MAYNIGIMGDLAATIHAHFPDNYNEENEETRAEDVLRVGEVSNGS
jgi:hypothetical protein